MSEPSAAEVREALERIVASSSIRGSPQLAMFLRFVVEAALRGEGGRLKGYTIGIEALGRDPSFDPQVDPIVRVEASRLRRAMDRYYADEGARDPVIITLPRGSYLPIFTRREGVADEPGPAGWRERFADVTWRRVATVFGGVTALVAVSVVAIMAVRVITAQATDTSLGRDDGAAWQLSASARGNGMPTIYIEPLRVIGQANNAIVSAATLSEKTIDAFARFDAVNIVPGAPPADALGGPRHDYALSGLVDYGDGRATIALKLIDTAEGTVAWSRTFEATEAQNPGVTEDKIIVAAATALLPAYGVIRSRDYARQLTSNDNDPRYRCLLEAAHAFRGFNAVSQRTARICLERLSAADPSFEVALSHLAMSYLREYRHGLEGPAGDPKMLEAALRTARRAIAMNPTRSRAHEVLMAVLFSHGDHAAAFAVGERAMELNPYNMMLVAAYGGYKIVTGDVVGGMAMLRRAGDFWEVRPIWQHFYLFLGHYLSGDARMAAHEASMLASESYPLGRAAEVLAKAALGETEQARTLYGRLVIRYPQWRDNARGEFARYVSVSAMADRLARDLAAVMPPATQ